GYATSGVSTSRGVPDVLMGEAPANGAATTPPTRTPPAANTNPPNSNTRLIGAKAAVPRKRSSAVMRTTESQPQQNAKRSPRRHTPYAPRPQKSTPLSRTGFHGDWV